MPRFAHHADARRLATASLTQMLQANMTSAIGGCCVYKNFVHIIVLASVYRIGNGRADVPNL